MKLKFYVTAFIFPNIFFLSNITVFTQNTFWEKKIVTPTTSFLGFSLDSNLNPYALTYNKIIYSMNQGENWEDLILPNQFWYRDILIDNFNSLYLASAGGSNGIIKSTDFGLSWYNLNFWNNMSSSKLFQDISGDIFAGGWDGVFKSTDLGINWDIFKNHSNVTTFINKKDSIVLIGTSNTLYFSTNNGMTWGEKTFNINNYIPHIWSGVFSNNKIYVSSSKGLFISSDFGTNWEYRLIDLDIRNIVSNYNGNIFIGTTTGIFYSRDGGENFRILNSGLSSIYSQFIKNDNYGRIYTGIFQDGIYKSKKSVNTFLTDFSSRRLILPAQPGIWDSILVENKSLDTLRITSIISLNEIINVIPDNAVILRGESKYLMFEVRSLPSNIYKGPIVFESNSFSSPDTLETEVYFGVPYMPPLVNFFPAESIEKFCVKKSYSWYAHGGDYGGYTKYFNNYQLEDTIILGNKFYLYDFEIKHYFMYDSVNSLLYTYIPSRDSIFLAADFNLNSGDSVVLYLDGNPWKYGCSGIYNLYYWDKNRKVMSFSGDNSYVLPYEFKKYIFLEGIGLYKYENDYSYGGIFNSSTDFDIISAVIDGIAYNKFYYIVDSTNARTDRTLQDFPFTLKVFKKSNNRNFIDTCYTDFYLYRSDTLVTKKSFLLSENWWDNTDTAFISLDSSILKIGDIIKYQIIMKDTSIYNNYVVYPGISEFISFKIISDILSIKEDNIIKKFSLFQNYPNPFNPTTIIRYDVPKKSLVEIVMFDILGRKVKILVDNEIKSEGRYEITFNSENLSSGVYFYRITAGDFVSIKKMSLIK